jgi:rare lipoprotein A
MRNLIPKITRVFSTPHVWVGLLALLLPGHSESLADQVPPSSLPQKMQTGKASYYCQRFHGLKTALGTIYNRSHWVAAHPTLPFGTLVRVTHLGNKRQVEVRIVDRGPTKAQRRKGIIIDVSRAAAEKLGMIRQGCARVRLEILQWGRSKKWIPEDHQEHAVTES